MNTISCNIIQDLIPLYIENMVSEDSKTLVEEHIAHCENCRIAVETMQRPVTGERDRMNDMKPLQAIKKKNKKRITALVTVAVLLTAVLCLAIAGIGYRFITSEEKIITQSMSDYSAYVGIDARSSYVSTEYDASNREALYTIFPETVPKSAKVSDFVYYYYNPWDPNYLVYLVYDCNEEDFEVECQRLRQIDSSACYAYYGVTGFPFKLEAVLANAYYGFTYCLSDADNHRLIYVQIYHCNYFSDIKYTKYIAEDHLPMGYDASRGNEYRKYMLSTTPDGEEIPGSAD